MLLMKIPTKLMLQIVPNIEDRVGPKINGKFCVGAFTACKKLYRESNPSDPELSALQMAQASNINLRYLHQVFAFIFYKR